MTAHSVCDDAKPVIRHDGVFVVLADLADYRATCCSELRQGCTPYGFVADERMSGCLGCEQAACSIERLLTLRRLASTRAAQTSSCSPVGSPRSVAISASGMPACRNVSI